MLDGRKRILSPFTGHKKQKAGNKTREKYMAVKRRLNLAETDRRSYCNKEEWLEEFLDGESAFYNGNKSGDSDNDGENYNENNEQQQSQEDFVNSWYRIVLPWNSNTNRNNM